MTAIDKSDFAEDCLQKALYCGVSMHYLIAVAQLRSGIDDGADGAKTGPFRLTQAEWDANRTDPEFNYNYDSTDITQWPMQCSVFALMTHRTQDGQLQKLGRMPSAVELYGAQWPTAPTVTLAADLKTAFDATAQAVTDAANNVLGQLPPATIITDPTKPPSGPPAAPAAQFNMAPVPVPPGRKDMAQLIIKTFGDAGLGKYQQAAGVANAIAESSLDPNNHTTSGGREDSYGLFQLNRKGGLGAGHTPAELTDPPTNIGIVLAELNKFPAFGKAASIADAVSVFVRKVERPANPEGEIMKRLRIAQQLLA